MDILRSNFKEHLESILKDVRECDFISCDGEFTGIRNESFKAMPFDTVAERYNKMKQGNMDYLMCQVGLCMFFQKPDGSYVVKPYNFYVLPQQRFTGSPQFICQASCITFLASHGFDFNKVFRDGICYLRLADESKIKDILVEKEEVKKSSATPISAKADDEKFMEEIIARVDKYLTGSPEDQRKPLNLESCSAFRRKLTYQRLEVKYGDSIHLQAAGEGKLRHIAVSKVNAEQKLAKEKAAFDVKLEQLSDAVGFSKVVKEISTSGKVMIGHNMLLDVMYIISQFLAELPDSYKEFKTMTNSLFPKLLDTKVMSSTYLFKDNIEQNSLDELDKVLQSSLYQQVNIDIPEGFPDYTHSDSTVKFHDAAYDSFITGRCFATMAHHVGQQAEPAVRNLASNSQLLTPFINKLFVNRLQDIPYMNLSGAEVVPDRDHVYHLTLPKTWTRADINQVFFPSMIYVTWIGDGSAMVTLQQRSDNATVKKMLDCQAHGCVVTSYKLWHTAKRLQEAGETTADQPGAKRPAKRKHSNVDSPSRQNVCKTDRVNKRITVESAEAAVETSIDTADTTQVTPKVQTEEDKLFAEEGNW